MGMLIDGTWSPTGWDKTVDASGAFVRRPMSFRHAIGDTGFPAVLGRYHLYVAAACPWAHRTLIYRALKGLTEGISVTVVDPYMPDETGWTFRASDPDPHVGGTKLSDVYVAADPMFTGRVTVPVLWDTVEQTIVNNESSEIIRMFNSAFDGVTGNTDDYYPEPLRDAIDEWNSRIYDTLNNGVYRCGFARSQEAYDSAVRELFDTMDALEFHLSGRRFLLGDRPTEADWRLLPTLLRFDRVYITHFKCTRNRLVDFDELWDYARTLYQWPCIRETVDFDAIAEHYYRSHNSINPCRIVPFGPYPDWDAPTRRSGAG